MSNLHRTCAKCGQKRADDMTVSYHRFPIPGFNNVTKAHAWATYCWPSKDWSSIESLQSLWRANKVLCGRHFNSSQFYDSQRQKLSKFAVPDSPAVEKLLSNRENVLNENFNQSSETDQSSTTVTSSVQIPGTSDPDNHRTPLSSTGKQPISANSSSAAENDNETIEEITVEDTQDCQEDDDVVLEDQTYGVTQSENDVTDLSESNFHVGYKCNVCDSDIKGFRYVCVQCVDWDMCSGCEAKAAHSHHYVLRVPGPRPLNEIQPILERIQRELMELNVFIEDSIKEENDLGDQMDPLQEEVNSIGVVNTLPDIEDEQMNSTLIFDNIDHFSSDDEVTNDTKQITTIISSVLPNTSNITKSESSGSSAMNITKSEGSAIVSVKCDLSVRPTTTCVANLQKSIFHTKKLSSKHFSSNLKVIDPKTFVRVERSDLKQKLSHIRSQSIKKK